MYFDLHTFLTIPRLIARERPGPRRALLLTGLYVALALDSLVAAVCLALDHVLFPGFRRGNPPKAGKFKPSRPVHGMVVDSWTLTCRAGTASQPEAMV